jgi:phosphoenolpyruvate-protein kinase (PTS system EI component)
VCEFFSFGTNDLTQMGFGFSRDDIGSFLPHYIEKKVLPADPFQTIDQEGIGELIRMGIDKGRSVKPHLKIGICGEHGGEPESVKFCHRVGMSYVSCSPFRVPLARLAAAQAAIADADRKDARVTVIKSATVVVRNGKVVKKSVTKGAAKKPAKVAARKAGKKPAARKPAAKKAAAKKRK